MRFIPTILIAAATLAGCATEEPQHRSVPMPSALDQAGFSVQEIQDEVPLANLPKPDYFVRVSYMTPQGETAPGQEVHVVMRRRGMLEIRVPAQAAKASGATGYNIYLRV